MNVGEMVESSSTMGCDACPGGDVDDVDGWGGGGGMIYAETEAVAAEVVVKVEASVDALVGVVALSVEADSRSFLAQQT